MKSTADSVKAPPMAATLAPSRAMSKSRRKAINSSGVPPTAVGGVVKICASDRGPHHPDDRLVGPGFDRTLQLPRAPVAEAIPVSTIQLL